MRRGRATPKTDEGDDDSSPMMVGTGVTMDFSAVDNPSLNVSVAFSRPFFLFLRCEKVSYHIYRRHVRKRGVVHHVVDFLR